MKEKIKEFVEDKGYVVFEIKWTSYEDKYYLRIYVDRARGGITMDECAQLNEALSSFLDREWSANHPYILEVSSPGIDWPLKKSQDWRRITGRKVSLILEDGKTLEGTILEIKDEGLVLSQGGSDLYIEFDKVLRAKQILEFK